MDDRQFDDLTKVIARRASRRSVLKGMLAGAVAGVFGSLGAAQAALSPVKTRPGNCINAGQPCGPPSAGASRGCCYKCNSSTGNCCETVGYVCTQDTDCCHTASGVQLICRDLDTKDAERRKVCVLPGTLSVGAQCTQGSECASGQCSVGVCQQCPAGGVACGTGCCDAKACQVCVAGQCRSKCGPCQSCDGNGNCVNTCTNCQTCRDNRCVPKCSTALCQTCNPSTGQCGSSCATCQSCQGGVCRPKCVDPCRPCNAATGQCTAIACPTCQECRDGVCRPKTCGPCQTCNQATGQCRSTCAACQTCQNGVCVSTCPANRCQVCNPATGQCQSTCGPCQICNQQTGRCVSGCSASEQCVTGACQPLCTYPCAPFNPTTGTCTPIICGPCQTCQGGSCVSTCTGCQSCSGGVCVDDSTLCGECGVCANGACIDDTTLCGPCGVCTNGACVDTDALCTSECDVCSGSVCVDDSTLCGECGVCTNGACIDDTTLCGPCGVCTNGACVDTDALCTGECDVCSDGLCVDDETLCPGQCEVCSNGLCVDDRSLCPGACHVCSDGACINDQTLCTGECETCVSGDCVDDDAECGPCEFCQFGACVSECTDLCVPCDPYSDTCAPAICPNCFTCDSTTGDCTVPVTCTDPCDVCDQVTGACVPMTCDPCETCVDGTCLNTCLSCQICDSFECVDDCDPCYACDPTTETCEWTCGDCEECDEYLEECVGAVGRLCGQAAICVAGTFTAADACDAEGICRSVVPVPCAPFICNPEGTACTTQCGVHDDCTPNAFCSANNVCLFKLGSSGACDDSAQCESGYCVAGVCCDDPCDGQCESCLLPGSIGTCTTVPTGQQPDASKSACQSDGSLCGGSCDGINPDACAYPGAATVCRGASCTDGIETFSATCDGAGACPAVETQSCAPYICGLTECTTSCGDDNGCTQNGWCDLSGGSGVCRQDFGGGEPCLRDTQCLTGVCISGVCCDTDCTTPPNATQVCPAGVCGFQCNTGFHTCNGTTCVSDSSVNSCGPTNCTPCPNGPANSFRTCIAGVCGWACSSGFHLCPGGTQGLCLSNTSPDSCGTSCTPCPNGPPNSTRTCTAGVCGYVCNQFYKACGAECIHLSECCTNADCTGGDTCHAHICCSFPRICGTAPNDFCCADRFECVGGTCQACSPNGNPCNTADDCCSGRCEGLQQKVCVCLGAGQECPGDPGICCSGRCSDGQIRDFCCDPLNTGCTAPNAEQARCCSGWCGGSMTCQCAPAGVLCNPPGANPNCCSGTCLTGNPFHTCQ